MRLIDPDKETVPAESDLGADKCSIPQLVLNSRDRYTTMLLSCQGFATAPISHLVIHTLAAWCYELSS